eukprot:1188205-Prorocentrum_minimum.AAC.8
MLRALTSFYGSSCAYNGKGALKTPETRPADRKLDKVAQKLLVGLEVWRGWVSSFQPWVGVVWSTLVRVGSGQLGSVNAPALPWSGLGWVGTTHLHYPGRGEGAARQVCGDVKPVEGRVVRVHPPPLKGSQESVLVFKRKGGGRRLQIGGARARQHAIPQWLRQSHHPRRTSERFN